MIEYHLQKGDINVETCMTRGASPMKILERSNLGTKNGNLDTYIVLLTLVSTSPSPSPSPPLFLLLLSKSHRQVLHI